MRIYKYVVNEKIAMPIGANIIHAACQGGSICIWAEVDETAEIEDVNFSIYPTGLSVYLGNREHVGTVFDNNLVWHIYKENK